MDYVIIESSAWEALKSCIEGLRERMSELFGSKVEPTELLPGETVCRILGVSRRTLQYYRDTAALPFVRIEHKCYYRREDVAALLAESGSPEPPPQSVAGRSVRSHCIIQSRGKNFFGPLYRTIA